MSTNVCEDFYILWAESSEFFPYRTIIEVGEIGDVNTWPDRERKFEERVPSEEEGFDDPSYLYVTIVSKEVAAILEYFEDSNLWNHEFEAYEKIYRAMSEAELINHSALLTGDYPFECEVDCEGYPVPEEVKTYVWRRDFCEMERIFFERIAPEEEPEEEPEE